MTIDLAAVRSARTILAAVVHAHPELASPAVSSRLAPALPEILAMTTPRIDTPSTTVAVRLGPDVLAAVDAEVARLRALMPGSALGRGSVIRMLVLRALAAGPAQGA
jgi:hypothetical protein